MADRELKIRITGDASGAVSAAKDTSAALQEASGSTKLFAGEARELHKTIHELSAQFPEAGFALRLLTNPVGGVLALGILTFIKAKEAIDEWNKSLDETSEKLADPQFRAGVEARRKALEEHALALAKYADRLEHLKDPEAQYQEQLKAGISLVKDMAEAQKNIANAQFSLDSNSLEGQFKRGLLSAEKYYRAIADLASRHRAEELTRQFEVDKQEVNISQRAIDRAKAAQPGLIGAVSQTSAASAEALGKVARDEANLEDQKKELKRLDALVNSLDPYHRVFADQASADKAHQLYKEALSNANEGLKAERQTEDRLPGERHDAGLADQRQGRAESALEANTARIDDLTHALTDLRDALSIHEQGALATAQIQNLAEYQKNGTGEGLGELGNISNHINDATAAQRQWLIQVTSFIQGHTTTLQEAVKVMQVITSDVNILRREIDLLNKRAGTDRPFGGTGG